LVLAVVVSIALRASPAAAQKELAGFDAAYLQQLIDEKGEAGIAYDLRAVPDLLPAVLSGIATGSSDWIAVYGRLRKGIASADLKDHLDDALARALSEAPENVLSYLHRHRQIAVRQLCDRNVWEDECSSGVLEPHDLLALVRRQRRLTAITRADLRQERAACLAATAPLVRRQTRIYLVSFGATEARTSGSEELSEAERRELEAAIAEARKDRSLTARRDGTFPDGPFRVSDVPDDVLSACAFPPLANPEQEWNSSDEMMDLPGARLLSACRVAANEWDLTCEVGGISPSFRHVRVRKIHATWKIVRANDASHSRPMNLWPDCRQVDRR
jgi:hypothetical protein